MPCPIGDAVVIMILRRGLIVALKLFIGLIARLLRNSYCHPICIDRHSYMHSIFEALYRSSDIQRCGMNPPRKLRPSALPDEITRMRPRKSALNLTW